MSERQPEDFLGEIHAQAMEQVRNEKWEATIKRDASWGPCAWYVSYSKGFTAFALGNFAWTEEGAKRKARRVLKSLQRQDERHAQQYTFTLEDAKA